MQSFHSSALTSMSQQTTVPLAAAAAAAESLTGHQWCEMHISRGTTCVRRCTLSLWSLVILLTTWRHYFF